MNETEQSLNQQIRNKNRKKLVQQNLKLIAQLKHLEIQIEALDNNFNEKQQKTQQRTSLRTEAQSQQRQIKQLKELIENEKHSNLKQNVMYIRKEEDELIALKRQLEDLTVQKNLVSNSHKDKVKKLGENEPLQKHKEQLQNLWAKTKKQNRQLNLKMVQMEREIRRYHNLKELSKNPQSDQLNTKDNEISMMNAEIQRLNSQMKIIQTKWKNNIYQLDKEFFNSKNTLNTSKKAIQQLQREEENWKRRSSTLRDQNELEIDRARLSKIKVAQQPRIGSVQTKKIPEIKRNFLIQDNAKKAARVTKLAASLSRAQSSPNPPISAKKNLDIKFNEFEIPGKKKQRYQIVREKPQKDTSLLSLQKGIFQNKKEKKAEESKTKESSKANPLKGQKQQGKRQHEEISHRQKHRIKSVTASHLAESLKRKAQEVKELNKKLQIQEEKYQKRSINKKQRSNQFSKNQISVLQNAKDNIKAEHKIQKSQERLKSPSIKRQKSDNSIKPLQHIKGQIRQKTKEKNQKLIIHQNKVHPKELVQNLQLKPNVATKQKLPKKNGVETQLKAEKLSQKDQKLILVSPKFPKQHLTNPQSPKSPSSPKNHSFKKNGQIEPTKMNKKNENIQIFQIQKPKASPISQQRKNELSLAIQLQDLDEGKPKIIKRKRPVEGNLVTTGTST